ncbi:histidine kinase [Saccharopolyspora sp. NPDC050389]|uniref:sensor histidine kinase n=1 Tax=Saccharopolyspora sp. NPDC050389 TaxID=3155516 RepID=UPI0034069813
MIRTEPAPRSPLHLVARRAAFGLLLAVFCVAATLSVPAANPVRVLDTLGFGLLVAPAVATGWASAAPRPVLVATSLAAVTFYACGYSSIFAPALVTVAAFTAVLLGRASYSIITAAATCLGTFAAGLGHGLTPAQAAVGPLWIASWMLASAGAAEVLRQRRQLLEHERERAEHAARRAAEQERLRIARELHDSLTHSISVINVQASVAAHLIDREPERFRPALDTIRTASADALRELRSTVEVLRRIDDGADPADEPEPGLVRLPQLVDRSQAAGLDVEVAAEPGNLPPAVDRAAYRIVQEALTNAVRHAPGARVHLAIARQPHSVRITVANGPARAAPAAGPGGGTGLIGMRERIDALGGDLRAGPDQGGFRVQADIPLLDLATQEPPA